MNISSSLPKCDRTSYLLVPQTRGRGSLNFQNVRICSKPREERKKKRKERRRTFLVPIHRWAAVVLKCLSLCPVFLAFATQMCFDCYPFTRFQSGFRPSQRMVEDIFDFPKFSFVRSGTDR